MPITKAAPLLYYPDFHPPVGWLRSVMLLTDEVRRIVPDDVVTNDPPRLAEMIEHVEGCLEPIAPEPYDIEPNFEELERLDKAFSVLSTRGSQIRDTTKFKMIIGLVGEISFDGFTFLYDQKIADSVRASLVRHNLVGKNQRAIAREFGAKNATVVRTDAAGLVLSIIADHLARRNGLNTVTNNSLAHLMTTLNGLSIPTRSPTPVGEGMLAAAFASALIPQGILRLRINDYRILRDSYSAIRAEFATFVREINNLGHFDRIEDTNVLVKRVSIAAKNLEKEFQAFKKSSIGKRVQRWARFGFKALLHLLAIPLANPVAHGGIEAGLDILEAIPRRPAHRQDRVLRLATNLEKDINALLFN
jgi:hypothetical protein